MLNIPESVKALFKTDGVHKNFRSQNNGISNENILQESVRFTESACSRDVFRFGCAERSVLEFETVGVGNLRGQEMQFWMDIDVSSLTAAEIAEIQTETWDGTLTVNDTEDDLSGSVISFDSESAEITTLSVDIAPVQSGSGTPSPTNIRPITGFDGLSVHVSPSNVGGAVYEVDWSDEAGTVYGGTAVYNGDGTWTLTVTRAYRKGGWVQFNANNGFIAYRQANAPLCPGRTKELSGGICNVLDEWGNFSSTNMTKNIIQPRYQSGVTWAYMALKDDVDPSTVEYSVLFTNPQTYTITTGELISTLKGQNNIWASIGDVAAHIVYHDSVFSVPLGKFIVDSCPRNHGAMTRRTFTCYSKSLAMPAVEAAKLSYAGDFGPDGYTPTAKNLVYSGLAPLAVQEAYTETSWKTWSDMGSAQIANTVSLGSGLSLDVLGTYRMQAFTGSGSTTDDALFSVSIPANPAGYWLSWLQQQLTDQGVTMTDAGLTRLLAWLDPFLSFAGWAPVNNPFGYGILRLPEPYYRVVYPYTSPGNLARLWLPENVTLTLLRGTTTVAQWTFSPFGSAASYPYVSRWAEISADTPIPLSIQPAVESMNGGQRVSYNDVYDFPSLVQGYLELNAMMARPMRRMGGYGPLWEFFRLDAAAAAPVGPADYASGEVWWDEYDVEPIGTVVYRYGEDLVQTYTFGDGESVYDMQDNEVLRLLAGATPAGINALLDALFVPYVTGIGFAPVEMSMQGWLYLQAGDALEITAEDATVVNTYAMRCEFNGVQNLTADIESTGGEIIEED